MIQKHQPGELVEVRILTANGGCVIRRKAEVVAYRTGFYLVAVCGHLHWAASEEVQGVN